MDGMMKRGKKKVRPHVLEEEGNYFSARRLDWVQAKSNAKKLFPLRMDLCNVCVGEDVEGRRE
jgi:hypothetical protein